MKEKISLILRILFIAATVVAEAVLAFCILRLDMLPTALAIGFAALLIAIAAGLGLLMFLHKRDKKVGWVRSVIGMVLAIVLVVGCLFGINVASEFYKAMLQITNTPQPNSERNVYVLADDPAQTITKAATYIFGTVAGYDESCTQQVLEALQAEYGFMPRVQSFENTTAMLDALYAKEVGAIIMNGSYLSILEDDSRYVLFSEETRILYTVQVVEEEDVEPPVIDPDTSKNISNTPFVIYLSGQDGYAEKLTTTRSDVNILMVVNCM